MIAAPVLAVAQRRARVDPVRVLLAKTYELGVRFRLAGATLQVAGAAALHPDDQAILRRHLDVIRERLEPPASPPNDLLAALDMRLEVVTTAERALEVLAELTTKVEADQTLLLGLDTETTPREPDARAGWIQLTRTGTVAKVQPDRDPTQAGLDPMRARVRLVQVFDPSTRIAYVLDLDHIPVRALKDLEGLPVAAHNAAFDIAMLAMSGVQLRDVHDTLLLGRLVFGAEHGGLSLRELADKMLGLDLSKASQVSDWSAPRLSATQYTYAAIDAAVVHELALELYAELDPPARRAFALGNRTVPVVAAMRLAGLPFDQATHEATIEAWERAYSEYLAAFVALTGAPVPPAGPQRSAWLERRLPADMLDGWPRTDTGMLRCRAADLDRLAAVPEVRPLLEVLHWDKRLRAFGHVLLERVGADGRLRMDLKPAATKTGRCSCSDPNLQQLPQDVRRAMVAPAGRTLVIADYSQVELRVAAELAGDGAMRQVFRDGQDMHRLNASAFTGRPPAAVTENERNLAKRVSFGTLYGQGALGLVASAWSTYRLEITEAEAQAWRQAFYQRFPALKRWHNKMKDRADATKVLRSIGGRPLRAEWEQFGLRWSQACNYPVQSSAADVMLIAMARVHKALKGRDAELILQVHDELVIECAESIADEVAALLRRHMRAAFGKLFPDAPVKGLVDVVVRPCWAKPKTE